MTYTTIPSKFIKTLNPIISDTDYIIGVKRVSKGGGSGTWVYIDINGTTVNVSNTYFKNHPLFSCTYTDKTTTYNNSSQYFTVQDPVFNLDSYFKYIPPFFIRNNGTDCYWIAPYPKCDSESEIYEKIEQYISWGFRLHPAFYFNGKPRTVTTSSVPSITKIVGFGMGVYLAQYKDSSFDIESPFYFAPTIDNHKSDNNYLIRGSNTIDSIKNIEVNKGTEGIKKIIDIIGNDYNLHFMNIYEYNAIQWLFLIQHKTTDINENLSSDNYFNDEDDFNNKGNGSQNMYYGIYDLWGSVNQFSEGCSVKSANNVNLYAFTQVSYHENDDGTYYYSLVKNPDVMVYSKILQSAEVQEYNTIKLEDGTIKKVYSECVYPYFSESITLYNKDGSIYTGSDYSVLFDTDKSKYYIKDNNTSRKLGIISDYNTNLIEHNIYNIFQSDLLYDFSNNSPVSYITHLSPKITEENDYDAYYPLDVDSSIFMKSTGKSSNNIFTDDVDHYVNMGDIFFPTKNIPCSENYNSGTYSDLTTIYNNDKDRICAVGGNFSSLQDGGLWSYDLQHSSNKYNFDDDVTEEEKNLEYRKYGFRFCYNIQTDIDS